MSRRIRIDPVTRLEGAGRIEILLDESGAVDRARFQVVDFKGFETFCVGRAAERRRLPGVRMSHACFSSRV